MLKTSTIIYVFQPRSRVLSAADAPGLLYWVTSILDSGAKALLIDLRDVSLMDNSGLGALVIAHNRVQKVGGRFALCSLNGQARMLFETAGMEGVIEVHPNQDAFEEALLDNRDCDHPLN